MRPTLNSRRNEIAGWFRDLGSWCRDLCAKWYETRRFDWFTAVFVALFLMLSGAMGNALFSFVDGLFEKQYLLRGLSYLVALGGVVLLVLAVVVVARKIDDITHWRTKERAGFPSSSSTSSDSRHHEQGVKASDGQPMPVPQLSVKEEPIQPYDVLIVPLSSLDTDVQNSLRSRAQGQARAATDLQGLATFCDDPSFREFPWQQALRAIQSQIKVRGGAPPQIIVAVSTESSPGYTGFEDIVRGFLASHKSTLKIETWGRPVNFERFDDVNRHLERIVQEHAGKGICIDITGGQKTFSAAATIVTANREAVVVSYISVTPSHGWIPKQYDVVHEKGDAKIAVV